MKLETSGPLLRAAVKAIKYYLLALFVFTIVCLLGLIFGASHFTNLLMTSLWVWIWRVALLILCFLILAIVCESLQE